MGIFKISFGVPDFGEINGDAAVVRGVPGNSERLTGGDVKSFWGNSVCFSRRVEDVDGFGTGITDMSGSLVGLGVVKPNSRASDLI